MAQPPAGDTSNATDGPSGSVAGNRIDIVLFHVDGLVEGYREFYEAHCGAIRPCQVRDLGELRYVLRSIHRYAPWAHRVLLVVQDRRHVPEWVDPSALEVVLHEDFIPHRHLPTFQVSTLQGHMHRIPGLSDQFIQWCDDYFLGEPVTPDFFFDAEGLPRNAVYDSPIWPVLRWFRNDLYMASLLNTRRVLHEMLRGRLPFGVKACFLFPHMPVAVRREWWAEMVDSLSDHPWFAQTITRKSRADGSEPFQDLIVDLSYISWVDMYKRRKSSLRRYLECAAMQLTRLLAVIRRKLGWASPPMLYGTFKIRNDPTRTAAAMASLAGHPPRFYCVNDDAYDRFVASDGCVYHDGFEVHPDSLSVFHRTMERLFPDRSRFERVVPGEGVGGD
ncbi:MAG: hypothetical protein WEA09_04875 [Gemmatimonadota bacterium]